MKNKLTKFLIIIGLICVVLILYFLISGYRYEHKHPDDYMECADISITATANFLRNYVKEYYQYKENSNIKKSIYDASKLTPSQFNDIKNNGATCLGWAFFYDKMAIDLGFDEGYIAEVGTTPRHANYMLIRGKDYCVLDQTEKPRCYLGG